MAVYTEVGDDDLRRFAADYDLGEVLACKGIAEGVENSNYLLRTERGEFVLTLYEKRVKPEDLPFFLALMEHLAGMGFPCPTPVKGRDGKALRALCGRPAAIVSFLDGMWPRTIQPFHCKTLGEACARFHVAGKGFRMRRPNALGPAAWKRLAEACGARADTVKPGLADMIAAEAKYLATRWPKEKELPAGVIHADLFPDNVFFLGENVSGFIDFYFACNDFLVYELAICLNAWCFERDGDFNATKARLILQSYARVRKIEPAEIQALPVLARGAALRFLLTRLYDWLNQQEGAYVKPKDPKEYIAKLRFHQTAPGPGAYGI